MKRYQTSWRLLRCVVVCLLTGGCLSLPAARADFHPIAQVHLNGVPTILAVDNSLRRIYVVAEDYILQRGAITARLITLDELHHTVLQTLDLGIWPTAMVVNPNTHQLYLFDPTGDSVTVIDGHTITVLGTIPLVNINNYVSTNLAVNPTTNKIYAAGGHCVNIIDGRTNQLLKTLRFSQSVYPLAVNTRTNRIYVAQSGPSDGSSPLHLYIFDGSTDKLLTSVPLPQALEISTMAINLATNRIYLEDYGVRGTEFSVLDGITNNVLGTISPSPRTLSFSTPSIIRFNERTDTVYVLGADGQSLTVFPGTVSQSTAPLPTTLLPGTNDAAPNMYATGDLALDTATGNLFTADGGLHTVDVLADAPAIYSISGYLTTASGKPLTNVIVRCTGQQPIQTDNHGYYSFSGLFGIYNVRPDSAQYTFNPPSRAATVVSGSARHIDFMGLSGLYLGGQVITPNGVGVSGVRLDAVCDADCDGGYGKIVATTYTSGNGYYGFSNLPAARYYLRATRSGYGFVPGIVVPDIEEPGISRQTTGLDITAYAAPYILGHVEAIRGDLKVPPGVVIDLTGTTASTGMRIAQSTVPANSPPSYSAQFGFGALPPGTYTLSPQARGYLFDPPTATVSISRTHNIPDAQFTVYTLSAVTLSSASAQSLTDEVVLRFTNTIDDNAGVTSSVTPYQIQINKRNVATETISFNDATHTVVFGLPPGALHKSDAVQVSVVGLTDLNGALLKPTVMNFIAQ